MDKNIYLVMNCPVSPKSMGGGDRILGAGEARDEASEVRAAGSHELVELGGREQVGQPPEGLDDRPEGQALAPDLDTAPLEDPDVRRSGPSPKLREEAGLADSGLAGHEDNRGPALPRGGEGSGDTIELAPAAHEPRTRDPAGHDPIVPIDRLADQQQK